MSKDDFDIYSHLRKDTTRAALNLLNGLENRRYGYLLGYGKHKEDLEIYAEEEFIRKKDFDELRCEMPGLPRSTFLMVFSPDGSKVASTHGNHNIYVTDIKSGKNIKTLVGHPRTPWCIAFHPTSDQIIASGCLGGQVRIWDLSGGSEVWTAAHQTVIASLAFHPNDRVLVIATYNEVYFWDWSQPEPFVHAATSNPKEKVRYVAFDMLGHKLITGIANSPQTRWERVRAPVPVPRQAMCSNPYRRRITQRLANPPGTSHPPSDSNRDREGGSIDLVPNIPLRERRITACYRNLVREYEQLVQRYLQLYRPPTMIDRGTDPMEPNPWFNSSGTQTSNEQIEPSGNGNTMTTMTATPGPSRQSAQLNVSSATAAAAAAASIRTTPEPGPSSSGKVEGGDVTAQPSTSESSPTTHTLITPSRIFSTMKKPSTSFRGTQTVESRKHKADAAGDAASSSSSSPGESTPFQEKRFKKSDKRPLKRSREADRTGTTDAQGRNQDRKENEKVVRVQLREGRSDSNSGTVEVSIGAQPSTRCTDRSQFRIRSRSEEDSATDSMSNDQVMVEVAGTVEADNATGNAAADVEMATVAAASENRRHSHSDQDGRLDATGAVEAVAEAAPTTNTDATSNHNINPTINGVEELLLNIRRTAEEEVRNRILPIINSVPANDRPELIRLFENGREHVRKRVRQMYPVFLRRPNKRHLNIIDSSESSTSDEDNSNSDNRLPRCNLESTTHVSSTTTTSPTSFTANSGANVSTTASISSSGRGTGTASTVTSSSSVRNFNTELEQLVTSLLTEIGRDDERSRSRSNSNTPTASASAAAASSSATHSRGVLLPPPFRSRRAPSVSGPTHAQPERDESAATQTPTPASAASARQPPPPPSATAPTSTPLANLLFQECLQMFNSRDDTSTMSTSSTTSAGSTATSSGSTTVQEASAGEDNRGGAGATVATAAVNTNTRTTNSTIYTSISLPRRRFFSHRISAFMPTRVNYTRSPRLRRSGGHPIGGGRGGGGGGGRLSRATSYHWQFALDELINYAERENSEDDPPPAPPPPTSRHDHNGFGAADPPVPTAELAMPAGAANDLHWNVNTIYSNILHDIEFSLGDVLSMRTNTLLGGNNSSMRTFSERLESIVNQSDTILRNVASSIEMMSNVAPDLSPPPPQPPLPTNSDTLQGTDPVWSLYDTNNFFMRERPSATADDSAAGAANDDEDDDVDDDDASATINLSQLFNMRPPPPLPAPPPLAASPVATDHTYPRSHPDSAHSHPSNEDISPIMSLIHMTISHIQRQAQQLRQRVEVIERMDRANIEISQLQLIRQLLIELIRYVRSGEVRNRATGGMSSVRQMMAGTRISDSSPHESTSEEPQGDSTSRVGPPSSSTTNSDGTLNVPTRGGEEPSPPTADAGSNAPGGVGQGQSSGRSRASTRKTYPPSRLYSPFYRRLARQCRRPSVLHFISRRYVNRAGGIGGGGGNRHCSARTAAASTTSAATSGRLGFGSGVDHDPSASSDGGGRPPPPPFNNFSALTSTTLSVMTRRLEHRLVEQMRVFMSMQPQPQNTQSRTVDLGEHILMLRLHGCVLRMNRILGHNPVSNVLGNIRADPTAAVTHDGVARYGARYNLSLLIDNISRNVEVGPGNLHFLLRCQILRVLGIGILLTELMLLVVVDGIQNAHTASDLYGGAGGEEGGTSRQQQQSQQQQQQQQPPAPSPLVSLLRFSAAPSTSLFSQSHARQLSRSLRLMRRTVHHAQTVLDDTYNGRLLSFAPYNRSDRRRQLLVCINRCLKVLRQRSGASNGTEERSSGSRTNAEAGAGAVDGDTSSQFSDGDWYVIVNDIVNQTAAYTDDSHHPSTSSGARESRLLPPERYFSERRPPPIPSSTSAALHETPIGRSSLPASPSGIASRLPRRIWAPSSPDGSPRSPEVDIAVTGTTSSNAEDSGASSGATTTSTNRYRAFINLINEYSSIPNQDDESSDGRSSASPLVSYRDRQYRFSRLPTLNFDYSDPDDDESYNNNNYGTQNGNLFRNNSHTTGQGGTGAGGENGGGNGSGGGGSGSGTSTNSSSRSYTVPAVQVNDIPVSEQQQQHHYRLLGQQHQQQQRQHRETERSATGGGAMHQQQQQQHHHHHNYPPIGLFRPRFLHPLYASVNPFDADLDDPQREQIYESDMVTTVTPNHRIQAWDVSTWEVPNITNAVKNVVVGECKIHNDASVDVARDGTILVTLLPSGGYLNVTNRLGVYSLRWESLGQCLYTTSFEQNAVSVSLSPVSRHLVVGLASRIVPSDRWIMARIFKIEQKDIPGDRLPVVRELQQNRDSRINCIRWLPTSGQGLIYATNTGQLVMMT